MKSFGERRIETQQIAKLLERLAEGETLTYERIRKEVGIDPQQHRHILASAIRYTIRTRLPDGLYSCVKGVGIRRLTNGDSTGEIARDVSTTHKKAMRTLRRSEAINYQKLTAEEKSQLNASRTVAHFVAQASSPKAVKGIGEVVAKAGDAIGFAKTLEHFQKTK